MAKAEEQKKDLAAYLQAGCKPEGKLAVGLAVEHFITHAGGEPVTFTQVQNVMRQMQAAGDMPILQDGQYLGFTTKQYGVTLESACQMEIRIAPQLDMIHLVDIYNAFYLQLSMTLATHGLRAWTVSYHPTRRAEELPLVPTPRNEAMDRYFRQTGACGVQMMRATASTQLIIDYYSERDFVQKMRAACLLTPFFGLLSDNAPIYQGNRNNACSVRTRIWQDVDTDRCGVPPRLMDPDFGFDAYADTVLTRPLVVSCKGGHCKGVGRKTAQEIYGARLDRCEIEHILSMFFFDARVNGGIEIRGADCMPPKFILAYAQLVRSIFGSQAALQNVQGWFQRLGLRQARRRRAGLAADAGPQPHALAGGARPAGPHQPVDRPEKVGPRGRSGLRINPASPRILTRKGVCCVRETSYHAVIAEMTVRSLWETQNVMDCIPDELWQRLYGGAPLWQHLYHALHSLDQWFINPKATDFVEPPIHTPHLQDLAIYPSACVDRAQMDEYFYTIKAKLSMYLTSLHDEDLLQRPENCEWTRFTLILSQYRHLHTHLGMLMGFIVAETGLCPRTLEVGEPFPQPPYDPYRAP